MRHAASVAFLLAGVVPAAGLLRAGDEPEAVRFVDVTNEVGVLFHHRGSPTSQKYLPETMGGGVALFDADGDERLDVFFVNGAVIEDPMPPEKTLVKAGPLYWNRLYRQAPGGRFEDVTERAGLAGEGYGQGVAVGDYDNDGDADLYVTGLGRNHLYRNDGGLRFTDVTDEAGVAGGGWSSSAAFLDVDHDGRLDLFVGRYMTWSFAHNPFCDGAYKPFPSKTSGPRAYCHPDNFPGQAALLYRNEGGGRFTEIGRPAGVADPDGKSLGVALSDFDGDGFVDVFVANDAIRQFLYRNRGDGTFEEVALPAFAAFDQDGRVFSGMGVDLGDYDNDGRPDVVVTNLANQCFALYRNTGDGSFAYETHNSGLGQISLLSSGWGVRFLDYDNDGWKDLFLGRGHVLDTIEETSPHLRYREPPLLARNEGGRFRDVSADSGEVFTKAAWSARGMAVGDIDDDGDLDVVLNNLDDRARVLRNEGGSRGHWVGLRLVGRRSNRDGIGSEVRVVTGRGERRVATATTAAGYLSASDLRVHLGLGDETRVRSIEVRWPSGVVQRLDDAGIDRVLTVEEPDAAAAPKAGTDLQGALP